jgi:DNA-binding MarR family transcriptional regulator
MTTKNADDTTYWLLLQVAIRAKHDFARLGELYDLSVMQLITLCSLEPNRPVPMNNISYFLACDASNVTGIVDRLVSRGLIERQESSEDRRVKVIQLTAKGEHQRKNAVEEIVATTPASMSSLSQEELEQLNHLLKKALLSK